MIRSFAVVAVLSCLAVAASAQTQPAPGTAATPPTGTPVTKSAVKKPAPKAKAPAKPAEPAESGPCGIGVISAIGDKFVVEKVGIMVFGNELAEVPVDAWGLDDLPVARVRAAAPPGMSARKISYAKGAFEPYDNPPSMFRNARDDLTALVRQITANVACERYFVFTKVTTQLDGTNQTLRGIGVLNRSSVVSRTSLFTAFQVTVFDGKTFEIYRRPFNLGAILTRSLTPREREPLIELDNASFPEPAAEATNSALLRERTRALLSVTLDRMLSSYFKQE